MALLESSSSSEIEEMQKKLHRAEAEREAISRAATVAAAAGAVNASEAANKLASFQLEEAVLSRDR